MAYLGLGNCFVSAEVPNIFDKVAIREHFQNLCAKVGVEFEEHIARAQAATQTRDWVSAYLDWTSCRDVIERSKSLLDRDDWLWLSGCHKLMCADLCAFYSMNFGEALRDAMAAFKAGDEVQNVPEALDFKSYVEPTLWKVMYLWASTSDCKEEALELDVKAFLNDSLGHARDSVSDSEVRTLKQQCKELVINKSEFVIWEVQKHYHHYSKTEECLQWACKGNELYKERYSGNLDYVSKFNEAYTLCMFGAHTRACKVGEQIVHKLDGEPWKGKVTNNHPAAQYCNPLYEFLLHQMLCLCYQAPLSMRSAPDGRKERERLKNLVNKHLVKCHSLSEQREVQEMFSHSRECLEEALKHTGNKWEEGYEKCFAKSRVNHYWVDSDKLQFLLRIYRSSKTKYRQSYESGSPDESHFSTAHSCIMKLLEQNLYPSIDSTVQAHIFVHLVQLYHEKDRKMVFLKEAPNSINVNEAAPILQYGKEAINCYAKLLVQHTKGDDLWLSLQEFYKDVYDMLQFHYFALWIASHECTIDRTCDKQFPERLQLLWNESLMLERAHARKGMLQEIFEQSLVWAERRVAKTIYFLLDPNMLSTSTRDQLVEFDLKDDVAWNALKRSRAACGPGTFVLEYSVSKGNHLQFVYVMTKEDEVFIQILNAEWLDIVLPNILVWLRKILSHESQESIELLPRALQWMYKLLISPVANLLDMMEQEDKLIIVAPEILSNVPFAALQKPNSPVGEGYLIQSHTISVTPSLRMIQHCDQRLKELDQDDSKPGIIVAVGDPACKVPLEDSKKEVDFIEELFGEKHVKKLVGSEATPCEVLKWAKYPSENRVKQVIFHIAAHGIGQDDGRFVKKGAILLARPASSCQQICDLAGRAAMPRAQDDENFDDDNANDETEPGDLSFSMVDVKEEAQISSHAEVGGLRTGFVVPISKRDPNILKSENISGCGFRWEAHMVVLSACDTARGQITGEGVLNLPRALMIAGVPCVVASQWKVGDSSTCELMEGFYQELRSGKDVSSSLRAAMLKMMKDEGNVHAWAPFFVCGLPTVCLPTELQAGTSSCKGHDCGTSSDTKAELRATKCASEQML